MRFLREIVHPEEKCARIGHKPGVLYRAGYVRPQEYRRHVCDRVTQERTECRRCREVLSPWQEVPGSRHGFTGFSWPSSQAEAFKRDGEYWTDGGWK